MDETFLISRNEKNIEATVDRRSPDQKSNRKTLRVDNIRNVKADRFRFYINFIEMKVNYFSRSSPLNIYTLLNN